MNIEEYADGSIIFDGYVLPLNSGIGLEAFMDAYIEAAIFMGHPNSDYPDFIQMAIVRAKVACQEILVGQGMRCSQDFLNLLNDDSAARDNGILMPSYVDRDFYELMDLDGNSDGWDGDEFMLWGQMENASGLEKMDLQQRLEEAGIYHEPGFELPKTPVGAAMACAMGGTGLGTIIGGLDAADNARKGNTSWKEAGRSAAKGSLVGCVASVGYYAGWWHSS